MIPLGNTKSFLIALLILLMRKSVICGTFFNCISPPRSDFTESLTAGSEVKARVQLELRPGSLLKST